METPIEIGLANNLKGLVVCLEWLVELCHGLFLDYCLPEFASWLDAWLDEWKETKKSYLSQVPSGLGQGQFAAGLLRNKDLR